MSDNDLMRGGAPERLGLVGRNQPEPDLNEPIPGDNDWEGPGDEDDPILGPADPPIDLVHADWQVIAERMNAILPSGFRASASADGIIVVREQ